MKNNFIEQIQRAPPIDESITKQHDMSSDQNMWSSGQNYIMLVYVFLCVYKRKQRVSWICNWWDCTLDAKIRPFSRQSDNFLSAQGKVNTLEKNVLLCGVYTDLDFYAWKNPAAHAQNNALSASDYLCLTWRLIRKLPRLLLCNSHRTSAHLHV